MTILPDVWLFWMEVYIKKGKRKWTNIYLRWNKESWELDKLYCKMVLIKIVSILSLKIYQYIIEFYLMKRSDVNKTDAMITVKIINANINLITVKNP